MTMPIDKVKVYKTLLTSWYFTLFTFLVMGVCVSILGFLLSRALGPVALLTIGRGLVLMGIFTFVLSPVIIGFLTRLKTIDRDEFPEIYQAMEEIYEGKWVLLKPRLYFADLSSPNAFAFGWGFFRGIAITRSLVKLLDYDELKSVLGHEYAHLRCRDVALMSTLSIIVGGANEASKLLLRKAGAGATLVSWPLVMLAFLCRFFSKVIAPIGLAALSQEREYSADALSALYTGVVNPLISALEKISGSISSSELPSRESIMSDLTISHPKMGNRTTALLALLKSN